MTLNASERRAFRVVFIIGIDNLISIQMSLAAAVRATKRKNALRMPNFAESSAKKGTRKRVIFPEAFGNRRFQVTNAPLPADHPRRFFAQDRQTVQQIGFAARRENVLYRIHHLDQ